MADLVTALTNEQMEELLSDEIPLDAKWPTGHLFWDPCLWQEVRAMARLWQSEEKILNTSAKENKHEIA